MMIPLGDVTLISTAYPFRRKVDSEEGGTVAVMQMRNIDADKAEGRPGAEPTLLRNDGGKYDRYLLREGDLLFQSRGSRYPAIVVGAGINGIAANGLHVIRPSRARLLPEYLAWWLNHPVSQDRLARDVARGTYIPFVSKRDLEAFPVPLPTIEVQAQIVAVDRLRCRERELRVQLDTLTRQLVDGATFAAAVRIKPGK